MKRTSGRLLAIFAVASFGLLVSAATANATGSNSVQKNGFVTTMYVQGSGLYVSEFYGYTYNESATPNEPIHVQVVGPTGSTICNSATVNSSNLNGYRGCSTYPNAYEAGGNYCAITWAYSGGKYYNDDEACLYVS